MFTHIARIVPKAIRKYGMTRQARAALVCEKYRKTALEIFPEEILLHVWPKYFRNKTLILGVDHPIFADEVSKQKHRLQELLNSAFGKEILKNIKTVVEERKPLY